MKAKKEKKRHFGRVLKSSVKKEEHNVSKIARLLSISRPTLYTRMKDGEFTTHQLKLLHEKKYIELTPVELNEIDSD